VPTSTLHRSSLLRFLSLAGVLCLAFSLVSCGMLAKQPEPTPSSTHTLAPTATNTPEPTATPTVTNTPKPTKTPTPNRTKLAEEKAKKEMEAAMEKIAPVLMELGVEPGVGQLGWLSDEAIKMDVESYNETHYFPLIEEPISDFILDTDIIWNSTSGLAGCNIIFRAEDDYQLDGNYQFALMRLQAAPAWDIEYYNWGRWQLTLTNRLKFDSVIKDKPNSTNHVTLMARGNEFTVYINGEKKQPVNHNKLLEGQVAVAAWQESGKTSCTYTNTWLWVLDPVSQESSGF